MELTRRAIKNKRVLACALIDQFPSRSLSPAPRLRRDFDYVWEGDEACARGREESIEPLLIGEALAGRSSHVLSAGGGGSRALTWLAGSAVPGLVASVAAQLVDNIAAHSAADDEEVHDLISKRKIVPRDVGSGAEALPGLTTVPVETATAIDDAMALCMTNARLRSGTQRSHVFFTLGLRLSASSTGSAARNAPPSPEKPRHKFGSVSDRFLEAARRKSTPAGAAASGAEEGSEATSTVEFVALAPSPASSKEFLTREQQSTRRSLMSLAFVVDSIAGTKSASVGIGWRSSKLTQLLKPALTSETRTLVMVAHVPASLSPAVEDATNWVVPLFSTVRSLSHVRPDATARGAGASKGDDEPADVDPETQEASAQISAEEDAADEHRHGGDSVDDDDELPRVATGTGNIAEDEATDEHDHVDEPRSPYWGAFVDPDSPPSLPAGAPSAAPQTRVAGAVSKWPLLQNELKEQQKKQERQASVHAETALRLEEQLSRMRAERDEMESSLRSQLRAEREKNEKLTRRNESLAQQLEERVAEVTQLRQAAEQLGSEAGSKLSALQDILRTRAKAHADELRRQEEAIDAQNAMFQRLQVQLDVLASRGPSSVDADSGAPMGDEREALIRELASLVRQQQTDMREIEERVAKYEAESPSSLCEHYLIAWRDEAEGLRDQLIRALAAHAPRAQQQPAQRPSGPAQPEELWKVARDIQQRFLESGAPSEVNISGNTRKRLRAALEAQSEAGPAREVFAKAVSEVHSLLRSNKALPRFLESPEYRAYVEAGGAAIDVESTTYAKLAENERAWEAFGKFLAASRSEENSDFLSAVHAYERMFSSDSAGAADGASPVSPPAVDEVADIARRLAERVNFPMAQYLAELRELQRKRDESAKRSRRSSSGLREQLSMVLAEAESERARTELERCLGKAAALLGSTAGGGETAELLRRAREAPARDHASEEAMGEVLCSIVEQLARAARGQKPAVDIYPQGEDEY
eukprot:m51a1_g3129 hypothetical protein (989) ;mRNA; r:249842-253272